MDTSKLTRILVETPRKTEYEIMQEAHEKYMASIPYGHKEFYQWLHEGQMSEKEKRRLEIYTKYIYPHLEGILLAVCFITYVLLMVFLGI